MLSSFSHGLREHTGEYCCSCFHHSSHSYVLVSSVRCCTWEPEPCPQRSGRSSEKTKYSVLTEYKEGEQGRRGGGRENGPCLLKMTCLAWAFIHLVVKVWTSREPYSHVDTRLACIFRNYPPT